jgi:site-specific DNA-cytosine methylase
MLMLDLCAGLGGASQAMKLLGWNVITLDIEPRFNCNVTADVRIWHYTGPKLDLIWASPPCREFSIQHQLNSPFIPDFSILEACIRIIKETEPRYWIIENVRGAVKWFSPFLGEHRYSVGPYFLWGWFPDIGFINTRDWRQKQSYSSSSPDQRAKIPY